MLNVNLIYTNTYQTVCLVSIKVLKKRLAHKHMNAASTPAHSHFHPTPTVWHPLYTKHLPPPPYAVNGDLLKSPFAK